MLKLKVLFALIAVFALTLAGIGPANADTVTGQGTITGNKYRGGVPSAGGLTYALGIQVNRDNAGVITKVRAVGRITKLSKVRSVQVDSVGLGTSTALVLANNHPVNAGTGPTAISYTGWRAVSPGTCVNYRARVTVSVRWIDGAVSRFSLLSPLSKVCRSAQPAPKDYANCTALRKDYPHGVGRPGAVDHTAGTPPVTNFYVSAVVYNLNTESDADRDGIACEQR